MIADDILNEESLLQIEHAIAKVESKTSAEVRVHAEDTCNEDVLDRAAYIFSYLEMNKTAARNGVLIYVAFKDKKLAIIGDVGIHSKIDGSFWEEVKNQMIRHFKSGEFTQGILDSLSKVGSILAEQFPIQDADKNELSNKVTGSSDIN